MEGLKLKILNIKNLGVKAKPRILKKKTFKRTLQQQQQFKDGIYIKYGRKGHFTKNCKGGQQNYVVKGTNILQDNNRVKVTREDLIKYFIFYYNSEYKVHKDAKYGVKWQL